MGSVILSYLKKDGASLFYWQYFSATMKDEKWSDFAKHPKTKCSYLIWYSFCTTDTSKKIMEGFLYKLDPKFASIW